MKKRLFMIRQFAKGPPYPDMFFDDKMEAKAKRDEIGGTAVVSYGPDHRLYTNESNGGVNK